MFPPAIPHESESTNVSAKVAANVSTKAASVKVAVNTSINISVNAVNVSTKAASVKVAVDYIRQYITEHIIRCRQPATGAVPGARHGCQHPPVSL